MRAEEVEIIPVTANEVVRILASLNIETVDNLLDEIRSLRKRREPDRGDKGIELVQTAAIM